MSLHWPWWHAYPIQGRPFLAFERLTPPAIEPVTVELAKDFCRVPPEVNDEDGLMAHWIRVAREELEAYSGLKLLTQTWNVRVDRFPLTGPLTIPIGPVQTLMAITYIDADGVTHTMPPDDYVLDPASMPIRIGLAGGYTARWPSDARGFQPITMRLVLGWTTPEDVPAPLREVILSLVALYFSNREANSGIEWDKYTHLLAPYLLQQVA